MRSVRIALLTAAAVAVALTVPAAAQAEPTQGAVAHAAADSKAEQSKVTKYWTPERMRAAEALDLIKLDKSDVGELSDVPTGKTKVVEPSGAETMAFPQLGAQWTGGGKVVTTSGRVFFTFDGRNASCSGNAVTSTNKSTVITAGHCVKYQGSWHTNWVFVPNYHDGQRPYGTWTAKKTLTTPQWQASEDINYDVGAAVVNPLNSQSLTDVVGGQGLKFNGAYNQNMYSFGFPAASPYNGEKLIYCSAKTGRDFLLSNDHSMRCNMTGGSSGGPWFFNFSEANGTGLQGSVNSFGYTFLPNTMFGPFFGTDAQNVYNTAQGS
ncbi:trypsin-like serine peptidase [Stackebrandtia nassauensis]|uniref:Peptidase n=1 Tax=Stackebrandtia nassauensis (strain DSM 44728 / CIP 108903 / NRRL B-16338 / NBRC 102104 / LLR-40K-21) TaxID=446470 RepID=D3PYC0_STANL|nr:peptidase [Stackebrandtia nassauensis]ADD41487.1 hypothetical protein Snas_1790 [Stackebrandtia nassauensis DSM 44728]